MATALRHTNETRYNRNAIKAHLTRDGFSYLSNTCTDLHSFNELIADLCTDISFDPAREKTGQPHQMVNAGLDEIGLHIENGNTPRPPRLVAFYCEIAASNGSETTLCDGQAMLSDLPTQWQSLLSLPMTVTRRVPAELWLDYLSAEYGVTLDLATLRAHDIEALNQKIPGVNAKLESGGDLVCTIQFDPIRKSAFSNAAGFANALLGPSVNYDPPCFRFSDGALFTADHKAQLSQLAQTHTSDVKWDNGDVVLIDNWRVMHGRRAILDPNRKLHIAMGDLA